MSATTRERDMLKTTVPERDMSVVTTLRAPRARLARPEHDAPWTAVWAGERTRLVWLHFWPGPTTPGGLAEAHEHVVAQVRTGQVPAQGTQDGGKGDG